jgi:Zn-dependent peptidase ImmA (M78 family)
LLHGKKDVFLEDVEHREALKQKEEEADRFAAELLLGQNAENEIIQELNGAQPTKQFVGDQANRFQTHPAIIVGRLQHSGIIRQDSALNSFKVPVNLF